MKVATASGVYKIYDNVWVKGSVMQLPVELKHALEARSNANAEGSFNSFYVAEGRKLVNGKKVYEQLIVTRPEAEKIIKKYNQPCVWFDTFDTGWNFWLSWKSDEELREVPAVCLFWDYLGRDPDAEVIDQFYQWLVHEFYMRGGYDGLLRYITERLSKMKIPQREDFFKPEPEGPFSSFFEEKPKTEKDYIDSVEYWVDQIRLYERAKSTVQFWGKKWRIVHVPIEDPAEINVIDEECHRTFSGNGLKDWLDYWLVSQTKAAEMCGVSPRTFRRWIAGKPPIPKSMMELLQTKIAGKKNGNA